MNAKVVKEFRDKYTGQTYKPNTVLEITERRFAEILTVGKFVEKIEEDEEPKKKTTRKKKSE